MLLKSKIFSFCVGLNILMILSVFGWYGYWEYRERNETKSVLIEKTFPFFSPKPQIKKSVLEPIILIATGDILLGRAVNYRTVTKNNFDWPFENIQNILKTADVAFINLEGPLIENCVLTQIGMRFCGDIRNAEGLVNAGVDVVNLANNHAGDYGVEGIKQTTKLLNDKGIETIGTGKVEIIEVKGQKLAFLGYNHISGHLSAGIAWADEEKIEEDIKAVRKIADIIIVGFHWGVEYVTQPTAKQKELAHLAIDSGADLIIGNHPHWIQPVEEYKGKTIIYALGNVVMDQMWSLKTRQGEIAKFVFKDKKLIDMELIPVQIEDYGQPRLMKAL